MPSEKRRAPARSRTGRTPRLWRALARMFHVLLVAFAGAFGAPPPRLLKHEDPICQVREDDEPPSR